MKYLTIILLSAFSLQGQVDDTQTWDESEIRQSTYQHYLQNPIDINQAQASDWYPLGLLNAKQIASFFDFKKNTGQFLSIWELQAIPDWDIPTLKRIQAFIICRSPNISWDLKSSKHLWIHRMEFTAEEKKGFSPPDGRSKVRYFNSPYTELHRYRGQISTSLGLGFLMQKDAGESDIADFTSFYLHWNKPKSSIHKIIIGDFVNQWGQGLVQAGGFSLGKSYESIISTQKFHQGALPYSSSMESGFYRGLLLGFQKKQWNMESFISKRKWDASVQTDSAGTEFYSTLITSGLHRTLSEVDKINRVQEWSVGNSISWQAKNTPLSIHGNIVWSRWSMPKRNSTKSYQAAEWQGQELVNSSISANFPWKKAQWMAEIALAGPNSWAILQGAAWAHSKATDFSYVFRYQSSRYFSPQAQAFGENSEASNELGLFLGNQYRWSKRSRLSSYLDIFLFPAPKYLVSQAHTWGWETLSRYQFERRNQYNYFIQIKWTSKQEDAPKPYSDIIRRHQWQLSGDFKKAIHKQWDWHSRLMATYIHSPAQKDWG
ncbi:hypothetical protein EWU23_09590 [Cytophagaceae bacterium 50C-KIRBA]|uniref:Capsule assembly Wzi family protein n=1 Tax=Aquirufa beregesia TaxID=2516556 RepID=A0ABX0F4E2_9BACT|nr:hypothetical protein [Aquirufa beregesia]NGZ44730.1 hypothetical protein [Aquirufa beregesia]